MQKVADATDISVLFFSAGANFLRKQRVEQCRHWCQQHQCYTVVVLSTQVLEAPAQSATVPSAPLHFMPSGLSFTSKRCIWKDPTFPPLTPSSHRVWKIFSLVCVLLLVGEIYRYNVLFMVDWQFTVFCREVGIVVIYEFLVLIFCGKICVCAIWITFCNSGKRKMS